MSTGGFEDDSIQQPPQAVYVGHISPKINSRDKLKKALGEIGLDPDIEIRFYRARTNALGYAFLKFSMASNAELAIENLNGMELEGSQCRASWALQNQDSAEGKIFIRDIGENIDDEDLRELLGVYGNITFINIKRSEGRPTYGYVTYDNADSAAGAMEAAKNITLSNGNQLNLEPYLPKNKRFTRVCIRNLPVETTEEEVKTMCGEYGPIVSVNLPTNDKGVRKGIAYVHFKDGPSALAAVEALDETEQDEGKNLSVARAKTKAERTKERKKLLAKAKGGNKTKKTPRTKLYVGNLDPGVDEDKLFEDFKPYGKVTEAQVKNGEKGVYGFVTYSKPGDATKALKGMETYKVEYARRTGTRGPRWRARQPPKEEEAGAED